MVISVAGLNQVEEYYSNVKSLIEKAVTDTAWSPVVRTVPEPSNQFDSKALAVLIDDKKVGYVAKIHQPDLLDATPHIFTQETVANLFKWGTCGPDNDKFFIQLEI